MDTVGKVIAKVHTRNFPENACPTVYDEKRNLIITCHEDGVVITENEDF